MPTNRSLKRRLDALEADKGEDPAILASRINDALDEMIRLMPCDFKQIDFSETKLRLLKGHQKPETKP